MEHPEYKEGAEHVERAEYAKRLEWTEVVWSAKKCS